MLSGLFSLQGLTLTFFLARSGAAWNPWIPPPILLTASGHGRRFHAIPARNYPLCGNLAGPVPVKMIYPVTHLFCSEASKKRGNPPGVLPKILKCFEINSGATLQVNVCQCLSNLSFHLAHLIVFEIVINS